MECLLHMLLIVPGTTGHHVLTTMCEFKRGGANHPTLNVCIEYEFCKHLS